MAWKGDLDFGKIVGMDPAANWLLGSTRADFLPEGDDTPLPFLLELEDDDAVAAFNALPPFESGAPGNGALVLGFGDDRIRAQNVLPVVASPQWFERLLNQDDVRFEEFRKARKSIVLSSPVTLPGKLLRIFPDFEPISTLRFSTFAAPPGGWPPGTVATMVIDDGIAFAHERFRDGAGETRVQSFHDMNHGLFGGFLTKAQIDADLAAATTGGVADEEWIYRKRKLVDYSVVRRNTASLRAAHGTHVLDLAAGYDPSENRVDRPIIAVQLPAAVIAKTSGELLDFHIAFAILVMLFQTDLPLVVNISLGYYAEQRETSDLLAKFLDRVVELRPNTQIVIASGNNHLSRCHAEVDFSGGSPVEFDWMVQPDDKTGSWFVVRLPESETADLDRLKLTVTPPHRVSHVISENAGAPVVIGLGIGLMEAVTRTDGRRLIYVFIAPTERDQPSAEPIAPSGRWRLRFETADDPMEGVAHVWVQRDDSIPGYPLRGRQSYFDHEDYVRHDLGTFVIEHDGHPEQGACPVTRKSLLNAIGIGGRAITAGGYHERDGRVARYSAGGPRVPPEDAILRKPDALAPSEGSRAHPGVLAAGSRSGVRVLIGGTSVAAPQVARLVADRLAAGPMAGRAAVKLVAQGDAAGLPADRGGWGRIPRQDPLTVQRFEPG